MIKRLIIFLIRVRLGLKTFECFSFDNQKSKRDEYYFCNTALMKIEYKGDSVDVHESNVSLNWLLNDNCKIHKAKSDELCQSV